MRVHSGEKPNKCPVSQRTGLFSFFLKQKALQVGYNEPFLTCVAGGCVETKKGRRALGSYTEAHVSDANFFVKIRRAQLRTRTALTSRNAIVI